MNLQVYFYMRSPVPPPKVQDSRVNSAVDTGKGTVSLGVLLVLVAL